MTETLIASAILFIIFLFGIKWLNSSLLNRSQKLRRFAMGICGALAGLFTYGVMRVCTDGNSYDVSSFVVEVFKFVVTLPIEYADGFFDLLNDRMEMIDYALYVALIFVLVGIGWRATKSMDAGSLAAIAKRLLFIAAISFAMVLAFVLLQALIKNPNALIGIVLIVGLIAVFLSDGDGDFIAIIFKK